MGMIEKERRRRRRDKVTDDGEKVDPLGLMKREDVNNLRVFPRETVAFWIDINKERPTIKVRKENLWSISHGNTEGNGSPEIRETETRVGSSHQGGHVKIDKKRVQNTMPT